MHKDTDCGLCKFIIIIFIITIITVVQRLLLLLLSQLFRCYAITKLGMDDVFFAALICCYVVSFVLKAWYSCSICNNGETSVETSTGEKFHFVYCLLLGLLNSSHFFSRMAVSGCND